MMRPGAAGSDDGPAGSAGPGAGNGRAGAPSGPVVAPPLPSADLYGGPDIGSATVYHERAVPVIESADLTPPAEASKPSPVLRAVAIVVVLVLLAGIGYLGFTKLTGSSTTSTAGPSSTVTSAAPPSSAVTTPPTLSDPATSPTTGGGASSTTSGGGAGGSITAPENVTLKVLANESIQVTWVDPSGGKAPFVYEVVSPDGQVLSKISSVGLGTTSTVVTETNSGPLKTEGTTYCVAVGAIAGTGKPLWAAAPCTDGTSVNIT